MNEIEIYLEHTPEPQRSELKRIRAIVAATVPEATEAISYGMPGFKLQGQYLVGYAAFKDHLSLFPTSGPVEDLKDKLQDYKISKGTIQFTIESPLSDDLIKEITLNRVKRING